MKNWWVENIKYKFRFLLKFIKHLLKPKTSIGVSLAHSLLI